MSVIKQYNTPSDLLEKLAREGERTWKAQNIESKADHFFNFCITSLSLRDWCIAYLKLDSANKSMFLEMHSKEEWLNYCGSIANSSKHFSLLSGRKSSVEAVEQKVSHLVTLGAEGKVIEGMDIERVSFDVETSKGETKDLMLVLYHTVYQWQNVFKDYDIPSPINDPKIKMFVEYN